MNLKRFSGAFALASLCLAPLAMPAQAQVTLDMSKVTCMDYAAMAPEMRRDFIAWMSGWYNQKAGQTEINLRIMRANINTMETWCARNRDQRVMDLIEAAFRNATPAPGGPLSIDIARVSCSDFRSSEAEGQFLLSAWIGGFVASERNEPRIDTKAFAKVEQGTEAACKKNRKAMLMPTVRAQFKP